MLEVLATHPARHGLRSRRGIAIAAVTVASLGVGGLAAAGPGFFQAAADRISTTETRPPSDDDRSSLDQTLDDTSAEQREDDQDQSGDEDASVDSKSDKNADEDSELGGDPAATTTETTDIECAEGNHGATVTSVVKATESGPGKGQIVSEAARSDCGKKVDDESDSGDPSAGDNGTHDDVTSDDDDGAGNGADKGNGRPENPGNPPASTPADNPPADNPPADQNNGNGNGTGKGKGND